MFPTEILQDISNGTLDLEEIFFSELYLQIRWLFIVEYIIKQSLVSLEDFYKTCVLISYKTSNSQHDIDNMPYWVFNNFVAYLNEILEEENKENGGGSSNEQYNTAMQQHQQMFKQSQSSYKSMMSGMKPPKL